MNKEEKKKKLEKALRENLLKRKQQQRARLKEKNEKDSLNSLKSIKTTITVLLLALLGISGCGKKNSPSPEQSDPYPREYPKP